MTLRKLTIGLNMVVSKQVLMELHVILNNSNIGMIICELGTG